MADAAIRALDCTQTVSQSGIEVLLARIRDEGGECFDAAGWHYLATLARHAAAHEGSVRRMLELKLERAATDFAERFAQARSVAADVLATTCKKHPQAADELQQRFADGDFKALRQLRATLEAREQCAALASLVAQLEPELAGAPAHARAHHATSQATAASSPTLELKTVRESRATWARLSVDRQLTLAMQQAPKNAGPINSHMLVLRSLKLMQDISPDYLCSLVTYFDTLLSLDPGVKDAPVPRKKTPGKTSGPGKAIKKA